MCLRLKRGPPRIWFGYWMSAPRGLQKSQPGISATTVQSKKAPGPPVVWAMPSCNIITGEGSADRQTLMGKLPMGVLQQSGGVPVCLIAGRISDKDDLLKAGFSRVACINPEGLSLEEAMRKPIAIQNIRDTVRRLVQSFER